MAKDTARAQTSPLEWLAAAIGLALLVFAIAVIGSEAIRGESAQPPSIQVKATRIIAQEKGYLVEFEATNATSGTAAAVTIEGELTKATASETATATLDYVAGNATVKGGLFFAADPRGGGLQLRALGYQEP
jgi:uncharacterized protein (TIGR02588 family)